MNSLFYGKYPLVMLSLLVILFAGGCAELPYAAGAGVTGDGEDEVEVITVAEENPAPQVEVDTRRRPEPFFETPLIVVEEMFKDGEVPLSNRWLLPDDARNTINPAQQKYLSDVVHRRGERSHTAPIYNMGNHASIFTIKF